jgi:DNA-binding SARP family transcriptional activator
MRLITLGQLALLDANGVPVPLRGHRRKLALLAYLALADGPVEREDAIAMFWPDDHDARTRRHSLSTALSFLRGQLGRDAITAHRSELAVAPGVLSVDARELFDAMRTRSFNRVLELYTGAFLRNVHVAGASAFTRWADATRERIDLAVIRSAEVRCAQSAQRRAWDECAAAARTWLAVAPRSGDAALHLLNALRAGGTTEALRAAIAEYDRLVELLQRDYRTTPEARVTELARRIESRVVETRTEPDDDASTIDAEPADIRGRATAGLGSPPQARPEEDATAASESFVGDRVRQANGSVAATRAPRLSGAVRARRFAMGWAGIVALAALLATNLGATFSPLARLTTRAVRVLRPRAAPRAAPRFAGLGTSNPIAAAHYVRAEQASAEGRFAEGRRELDAAVALDSGFASALLERLSFAVDAGDSATIRRLRDALSRARFTEWDILTQTADSALYNGERGRAERLLRMLVARYPHDPRAYSALGALYQGFGEPAAARRVLMQELALDSVGVASAGGPCVPCRVYADLTQLRAASGDFAGAESTARRWLAIQPELPAAWAALASVMASTDRFAAAHEAEHRAEVLSGGDPAYAGRLARELIAAREFRAADSVITPWLLDRTRLGAARREHAEDALALLQRERGEFRASLRTLDGMHDLAALFEQMDGLSRLGDAQGAVRLFQSKIAELDPAASRRRDLTSAPLAGNAARAFCWSRAQEAEALAGTGDTVTLHALADSIRDVSARSYYGRDWRLHHHVLGRIAMLGGRYAEAEREFEAARWGVSGWTVSLAWLARAQLAQGHALDAVATLRQARAAPLDAMGRYEPHSELDYLSALAFMQAGRADSARVYAAYARNAWRNADPEVRRVLAKLP